MKDTGRSIDEVADFEAPGYERVGDQPPMTAPPEGLGAHDCQVVAGIRARPEIENGTPENIRVHVHGIGGEGG